MLQKTKPFIYRGQYSRDTGANTGRPSTQFAVLVSGEDDLVRNTTNLPFTMRRIELPRIPARSVSVTEFGAAGNGETLNTAAFTKAIEACAKSGGGRIVVPQGIWLTGASQLKSNIDLHLERGAVIQFR